jgi:hypothetical protein
MSAKTLICIVEGDGEVKAVPILARRILEHLRRDRQFAVDPDRIICTKNGDRITEPHDASRHLGIEFYVQRAAREKPAGILVIVDAEERCQKRAQASLPPLGPHLVARAAPIAGSIPLGVVVANRMFESWFLADFHSLRSRGHLPKEADFPGWAAPEAIGGPKWWMKNLLGDSYSERTLQPKFAEHISLPVRPAMQRRAPSFWKLFRELDKISR